MATPQTEKQATRAIRAEAAAWIAKLHGPDRSAELEIDFRSWLGSHPHNASAFEHVTEIWEALGSVDVGGLPRLASDEAFDRKPAFQFRTPLAVACLLTIIVGAVFWRMMGPVYSTDIGEQRIVHLDDGSRLSLNAQTRVAVDYSATQRIVRLKGGEVFCEVAKDATRPFLVIAGNRTVTALGTAFVVRYESDETSVTLVEGAVSVAPIVEARSTSAPAGAATVQPKVLLPGQRLTIRAGHTQELDIPRAEVTAAWRRGEVILDHTPLKEALREMNRYDRANLVLDDEALGDWPVSGIYRLGNNQDFAHAISVMYGLAVVKRNDNIHLNLMPGR